ncbi:MAG: hypothetical protein Q8P26_05225 [Candidatus Levybacteria bacterium]|nr:hypothetical protein [Candidatus Levybacteria bacterium]
MKKIRLSAKFLVLLIIGLFVFLLITNFSFAAVSDWQKSASIVPRSSTDFSSDSFKESLINLKSTGANYVSLIIPLYQSDANSTTIFNGWNTPTDESLIDAVNYAHSMELKVSFTIHMEMASGGWRANINPSDRTAWFKNYGDKVRHYSLIAKNHGVEEFALGAELYNMTSQSVNFTNTQNWNDLISSVRAIYPGILTYSSQRGGSSYNEVWEIGFWDKLDYLGLSAYYSLASYTDNPTVDQIKSSWNQINNQEVLPLSQRFSKPLIITEVGYISANGANKEPWNWLGGGVNLTLQSNLYEGLFSFWDTQSFLKGIHLWDWSSDPNAGGSGSTGYTPQDKPAQDVMTKWFTSSPSPTPTPTPTDTHPPSSATFKISTTTVPANPNTGQSVELVTTVTSSSNITDAIIDIELYNSAGRIFQKYFEHQNLSANTPLSVKTNFTPSSTGSYTVKVGIFNSNWSALYFWENNSLTFTVGNSSATPTPTATPTVTPTPTTSPMPSPTISPTPTPTTPENKQIEIWWPTDGVTISGIQPFKALVSGIELSQYQIFWQVDGDRLNLMGDSNQDAPHKESLVDVGGWNWQSSNQYKLNFVAKDLSGNILIQKLILINVAH